MEQMELRTHTRLWQVERKLYKLYDYTLPMPISLRMLGIMVLATVPWFTICGLIGVHFGPPFGHLIWIAPPVLIGFYANRPVMEAKRMGELIASQASYWGLQPKTFTGLQPNTDLNTDFKVYAEAWSPHTPIAADPADA